VSRVSAFRVTVAEADEDTALAFLQESGTLGAEVQSAAPGEIAFLAYFPTAPGLAHRLKEAFMLLPAAQISEVRVPEVDWVAHFREGFRAVHAAGFLIAPVWDVPDSADRSVIVVDPGQAFGTGTHETTRLCLTALRDLAGSRPLGRVLDVGTGSGILAVAAFRLGASLIVGIESDPEALPSTAAHGRMNHAPLHLVRGDGAAAVRGASFDVVMANITAPVLQARQPEIAGACRPGGAVILSGLLREDLGAVGALYAGAGGLAILTEGDWAALVIQTSLRA
jgi:ribosomal protein L11 methyltransferase